MDVNILLYMEAFKHSVFIYNSCSFSHANFNLFPFHWNTVLKPQCEWTYWSLFPTDYSVGVIVTVSALIVIRTWITSVQRNIIFTNQQQFHEQSTVMYFVVEHRLAYKWLSCSAFNSRLCCIGNKTLYRPSDLQYHELSFSTESWVMVYTKTTGISGEKM